MNITVREDFIVKCPLEKIRLLITADNRYNFTLLTYTGSGNNYSKIDTYDMDPIGVTCSNL